ncbi:hypothetical protein FACS1894124_6280 [Spirochaetia bacterium]|nr:hypothetical protein FACS1894124_6280 [Spirochaetia bacterium]
MANEEKPVVSPAAAKEPAAGIQSNETLVSFIQKNRKPLIAAVIGIIVLFLGFVAALGIRESMMSKSLSRLEALNERYEALRMDITDPEKEADVQALLDDLDVHAKKSSGYAGARSGALIAAIHADRKNWTDAEKAWVLAAKKAAKTYFAPAALYNAAVAAEEDNNIETAIAHYTEAAARSDSFPQAARAQFQIGRLEEGQENREAALAAYRTLIEKWPSETVWTNLANSRIIALSGGLNLAD